jgi:hypothetical protein
MDERRALAGQVEALIERVVRGAKVGDHRARAELRRELESHFEEAGSSPEALRAALERFGDADAVGDGFRRAYRPGRVAAYVTKIAASVLASAAVAFLIQALVNLRVDPAADALRLSPGYAIGSRTSLALVLLVVAAWELDIAPLCVRLERRPVRLLAMLGAFFAAISLVHGTLHPAAIDPALALLAGGVQLAVWTCTIAIVARLDVAFLGFLGGARG